MIKNDNFEINVENSLLFANLIFDFLETNEKESLHQFLEKVLKKVAANSIIDNTFAKSKSLFSNMLSSQEILFKNCCQKVLVQKKSPQT